MSTTTDTTGYEGPLAQIEAALDQLVSVEDWRLTDDQVLAEVDGLGVLAERMAGLRLRRAGVVESRGICKARGWTTADHHLMVTDRKGVAGSVPHPRPHRLGQGDRGAWEGDAHFNPRLDRGCWARSTNGSRGQWAGTSEAMAAIG